MIKWLKRLLEKCKPETGVCHYCGRLTSNRSEFSFAFLHKACAEADLLRIKKAKEDRAQIELMKRALREHEEHKHG